MNIVYAIMICMYDDLFSKQAMPTNVTPGALKLTSYAYECSSRRIDCCRLHAPENTELPSSPMAAAPRYSSSLVPPCGAMRERKHEPDYVEQKS